MKRFSTIVALMFVLALGLAQAETVSDEALYDNVRIAIANDRVAGGGNIQVSVTKAVVELTGTVKHEKIKNQAGKVAKKVKGVKQVENKLRVAPI